MYVVLYLDFFYIFVFRAHSKNILPNQLPCPWQSSLSMYGLKPMKPIENSGNLPLWSNFDAHLFSSTFQAENVLKYFKKFDGSIDLCSLNTILLNYCLWNRNLRKWVLM